MTTEQRKALIQAKKAWERLREAESRHYRHSRESKALLVGAFDEAAELSQIACLYTDRALKLLPNKRIYDLAEVAFDAEEPEECKVTGKAMIRELRRAYSRA